MAVGAIGDYANVSAYLAAINAELFPPGAAQSAEYGASNPTSAIVGVASSQVLAIKYKRKSIILVNDSPNIIYLSKRQPAVLNTGIRLNANGGSYWEPDTLGNVWKGSWYAIATVAGSNLCITEDW